MARTKRPRVGDSPTKIKCDKGRCCVYKKDDLEGEPLRCFVPKKAKKVTE